MVYAISIILAGTFLHQLLDCCPGDISLPNLERHILNRHWYSLLSVQAPENISWRTNMREE